MKNITRLRWNYNNIKHIARHGVNPAEVEEVVFSEKTLIRSGRKGFHYVLGKTMAGRYLFVMVETTGRLGEAIVVTARDMTDKEQKYYKRRGK